MKYYKCKWNSPSKEDPFNLIFEVDDKSYEKRKIEIYKNGKYGYAYDNIEINGTRLGKVPLPSIDEIIADKEFEIKEIKNVEFEFLWKLMISDK